METKFTRLGASRQKPLVRRNPRAGRSQVAAWENEGGSLRSNMNSIQAKQTHRTFQAGEPVVILYNGLYNGMLGNYQGLREDPEWVDIEVEAGVVRAYPLQWIRHAHEFEKSRAESA